MTATLRDLVDRLGPVPAALQPFRSTVEGARDRLVAAAGVLLPPGPLPFGADDLAESLGAFRAEAAHTDHPAHLLRIGLGLEAACGAALADRLLTAWRSGLADVQLRIVGHLAPQPVEGFALLARAQALLLHDAGVVALVMRELAWSRVVDGVGPGETVPPADAALLQTLVAQLPLGVMFVAGDRVRWANPFLAGVLGFADPRAFVGRGLARLLLGDGTTTALLSVRRAVRGDRGAQPWTWTLRRADGGAVRAEVTALPVLVEGVAGCALVVQDVTAATADRARFLTADRRATIGLVASGVVHEVGSPLTVISFAVQSVRRQLAEAAPDEAADCIEQLDEAVEAAGRIRRIVRDVKALARPDGPPVPIPVDRALERAVNLAWNRMQGRVLLTKDYAPTSAVLAGEGGLTQVFLNLLDNAGRAVPAGAGNARVVLRLREEEDAVVATVEDTGVGISPDHLDRVWEPFFTTWSDGAAGLGLPIARSLVEGWGGQVQLESAPGQGTRVHVRLPRAPELTATRSAPPTARVAGRVLVVEPAPRSAALLTRALGASFDVQAARSVEEAEAAIVEDRHGIDAVVCAVPVPGGAMALVAWLKQYRPDLARRVVFLGPGTATAEVDALRAASPCLILDKPVDMDLLLQFLRALVDLGGRSSLR